MTEWKIVTDGVDFAIRRKSYFFGLWWVYRSLYSNNEWSTKEQIYEFCWGSFQRVLNVYKKIHVKRNKSRIVTLSCEDIENLNGDLIKFWENEK